MNPTTCPNEMLPTNDPKRQQQQHIVWQNVGWSSLKNYYPNNRTSHLAHLPTCLSYLYRWRAMKKAKRASHTERTSDKMLQNRNAAADFCTLRTTVLWLLYWIDMGRFAGVMRMQSQWLMSFYCYFKVDLSIQFSELIFKDENWCVCECLLRKQVNSVCGYMCIWKL